MSTGMVATAESQGRTLDWFQKDGSQWTEEDRGRAAAYLKDQWANVVGADPQPSVNSVAFAEARDRFVNGARFRGGASPELFRDHLALHLRSLMLVLTRGDTKAERERARELLESWLTENLLPRARLVMVVKRRAGSVGVQVSPNEPKTLIALFCRTDLRGVIQHYNPPDGSAWDYLSRSFRNLVHRQLKPAKRNEKQDPDKLARAEYTGRGPEHTVKDDWERRLQERRVAEYEQFKKQWLSGEKAKEDHNGNLSSTCVDCRQLIALHLYYRRRKLILETIEFDKDADEVEIRDAALHQEIAEKLGTTNENSRVLLYRARQRLKEGLASYPIALSFDEARNGWRVELDRFAIWDTSISISCGPADLVQSKAMALLVAEGLERSSDVIRLSTTPYPASRPTAFTLSKDSIPADATVRFDQARLAASANGRTVETWLDVPPLQDRTPVPLALSSSEPRTSISLAGTRFALPTTQKILPGTRRVSFQVETSCDSPSPARVSLEPQRICGGDTASASVTLGAELVVEANGASVRDVFPIEPMRPVDVTVTSSDPLAVPSVATISSDTATFEVDVSTEPVDEGLEVEIAAESAGGMAKSALTLLPPPPVSLRLLDQDGRAVKKACAGAIVVGELELAAKVLRATSVELSLDHRGVAVADSSPVIQRGEQTARFNLMVALHANTGRATISARVNDVTVHAAVDVVANGFKRMTLKPRTVVGGRPAQGRIKLLRHVAGDVTLTIEPEDPRFVRVSPGRLTVQEGADEVQFDVETDPVGGPLDVKITVSGFGDELSETLAIKAERR